jgi:hypothetical protein
MKTKTLLAVLALAVMPSIASAACIGDHAKEEVVMSCADGTEYDSAQQACIPTTS